MQNFFLPPSEPIEITAKADVWAFGATFCQLIFNHHPYYGGEYNYEYPNEFTVTKEDCPYMIDNEQTIEIVDDICEEYFDSFGD